MPRPELYKKIIFKTAWALLLSILISCSAHKHSSDSKAYELEQLISRDFRIIRNQAAESYLQNIKNRLFEDKETAVRLIIAKNDSVFALSFGAGLILVSSGLIEQSENESEFAFILAHEFSHIEQRHFTDDRENLDAEELKGRELQADSQAFELLYEAGFSISAAISSINKFNALHPDLSFQPSTSERLENLRKTWIVKMCGAYGSCSNTGVRDSREFQAFRKGISDESH